MITNNATPDSRSSVLEAFMDFPLPLALLERDGHPEVVNTRFSERFGTAPTIPETLPADAQGADTGWHGIRLVCADGGAAEVRVRAIKMPNRVLLVVEDGRSTEHRIAFDRLRERISELEQLAATDHLTGAWNRAHLDRVIEAELARSLASRIPLSLILFDLDHFKQVNDTFGHLVGDSVLRELVRRFRGRTRASDLVFRWGGEEFAVLVTSAGYRHAEIVAQTLRLAVASRPFEGAGALTISAGVAEHDGDEDASTWFRRLDAALYEAKRSGRNRVVVARRGNSDAWATAGEGSVLNLVWQEGYECGNRVIDDEHRELFRLANSLIDASVREQTCTVAAKTALKELLAHVQRHFADEEEILSRLHYDHLAEHRRAHAGLIRRALAMEQKLVAGEAHLGAIVEFLAQDVVARHMLVMDRAFFPLFLKATRAPSPS